MIKILDRKEAEKKTWSVLDQIKIYSETDRNE